MEEKQLCGALTVYRERGAFLRRLEQFEEAKAAYDEAAINKPDDVRTLVGRSRVCADAVQLEQAYADAEAASQLEPQNMIAKYMKAQAMYEMGEFEKSLLYNVRGQRLRRKPPYFTNGINQGNETVQDCVGENAGSMLQDMLPVIRRAEASRPDTDGLPLRNRVSRIPMPYQKKKLTIAEARRHTTLSRVLAMKYMGRMASDKFFLRELARDPRLQSANARGSRDLRQLAYDAFGALRDRQEMLRTRRPYYTVRLAEAGDSKRLRENRARVLQTERDIGARTAETMLKHCDEHLKRCNIRELIAQAERMRSFLDTKTERTLPDKDIYIERLYRIVGEGYLSMNRLSYAMSDKSNRRRVRTLMGMPVARQKSFDSVLAFYPTKFRDLAKEKETVEKLLHVAEVPMERLWLMHELARLLILQKNYSLAKFYAKRCQRESEALGSHTWWLNACFVLMTGDMQQGNTNEVRIAVEEALEFTRNLPNMEQLVAFLEKCLEMASAAVSADERKAIEQRERDIQAVMEEQQRIETQVLFKRMSTVPTRRRFSVLPQKAEGADGRSERRARRQRGLSVVPGPESALPAPPRTGVPGLQAFDL